MSDINYISEAGLEKLKEEFEERKTVERKNISEQIARAKEQGDLSENFEYQDAKDRQADNERRIIELETMINKAVIVKERKGESTIGLGSTFMTEVNGSEKQFEIVGGSETDPLQGKISNDSPLGNAFLGKSVGETTTIKTPSGEVSYKIISIE